MDLTPPEGSLRSPSGGDPEKHRPLERRTAVRTAVVWDAVRAVLGAPGGRHRSSTSAAAPAGSRSGSPSSGHQVTVVDPSPDALAALGRRAAESDVADRVTGLQGDLASLVDVVDPTSADLVLCHGVLELVDDPAAALAHDRLGAPARRRARPCWSASATPPSSPGRWPATSRRPSPRSTATRGPTTSAAERRFTAASHRPARRRRLHPAGGARRPGFTDLVPGSLLDLEPGAGAALLELERAVADRPEYLTLATQLHVLATH